MVILLFYYWRNNGRTKESVIKNAYSYKKYFVDYEYLLCSAAFVKNEYYIVSAYEDNYLHLTGLHTNLPASTFFEKCYKRTLEENDFDFCKRPNAVVTVVALYDKPQSLPLPDMYGKNLTFKTGGVDGCDCEETLRLIAEGKINTEPLITHTYSLDKIEEAYYLFENKIDHVIKVAIEC